MENLIIAVTEYYKIIIRGIYPPRVPFIIFLNVSWIARVEGVLYVLVLRVRLMGIKDSFINVT